MSLEANRKHHRPAAFLASGLSPCCRCIEDRFRRGGGSLSTDGVVPYNFSGEGSESRHLVSD